MVSLSVGLPFLLCLSACNSALETTETIYGAINESAVLRPSSLLLDPSQIQWHHNGTMFIFYNHRSDLSYPQENKFQLDKKDGSLQIFNLNVTDAGNYKVTIMKGALQSSKEVKLTVFERIKKPELKVLHKWPGTGFCLVNVTCITMNNHSVEAECNITSSTSDCTETKESGSPDLSIHISAQRKLISCNSSNIASSNSKSIAINEHCEDENKGSTNGTPYTACVFLVELLLLVALL